MLILDTGAWEFEAVGLKKYRLEKWGFYPKCLKCQKDCKQAWEPVGNFRIFCAQFRPIEGISNMEVCKDVTKGMEEGAESGTSPSPISTCTEGGQS